ncbi:MAG: hypothetical protein V4760_03330 [Bdellovibrionota bacterium]
MKAALATAISFFVSTIAFAAPPRDCGELEKAYRADAISQYEEECFGDADCAKRQSVQLREAAKERDAKYDPTSSDEQLEIRYGAGRKKLVIGGEGFDGVSLFIDFMVSLTFFESGTATRAPISYDDGFVVIAGQRCATPLAPYLSPKRQRNLCEAASEYLRSEEIGTQIDVETCLDAQSEFRIENFTDSLEEATISFTRTSERGDVDLICLGTVDRATDGVSGAECMIPE